MLLPFAEAEGIHRERLAQLKIALRSLGADLYLSRLVEWIACNAYLPHADETATVRASYADLADDPWGLPGVSPSTIRRTIAKGLALGLITATATYDDAGRDGPREYGIAWDRIRAYLRGEGPTPATIGNHTEHGPVHTEHGPVHTEHGPVHTEHPALPAPIPEGETPHAPAHTRPHAPPTFEYIPTTTTTEGEIQAAAIRVASALWPGRSAGITDRRDQRLTYRLAVLLLDARFAPWIGRALADANANRAKSRPAMLQAMLPTYAPAGIDPGRLLASIDVPRWALADPRTWPAALDALTPAAHSFMEENNDATDPPPNE
jgi:hypothetical protein